MIYTKKERTLERHDVNFIIAQARAVLDQKRIPGLCSNNCPRDYGQLYTTQRASEIIDSIVADSIYYNY
jgi:hypothetical protein